MNYNLQSTILQNFIILEDVNSDLNMNLKIIG